MSWNNNVRQNCHTYLDMVEEKRYEERPELANLSIGRKRKVQYRAGTN